MSKPTATSTATAAISSAPAIALRQLSKSVGGRPLVSGLELTVRPGALLGFLGPNGAGKTTTLRLIAGFLRPTAGLVTVLGHDMHRTPAVYQARQQLGVVPDGAGLDPRQTGQQLLDQLARLQGQPAVDRAAACDALALAAADLGRPMGQLSRGTRQKINLVQGLQHRPAVVLLDEPTEALDPLTKQGFLELLRAAQSRGATVIFSSHVVSEVEAVCDEIALIRAGRLIVHESLTALRQQANYEVQLGLAGDAAAAYAQLAALPTVAALRLTSAGWAFEVAELTPLLALLITLPVADLSIAPPSLTALMLRSYGAEQ